MENECVKIRAYKANVISETIGLAAVDTIAGKPKIATGFRYTDYKRFQIARAFSVLDTNASQTLMDDLWACGIRPTEGKGSAGSLAAIERHLKDMRTIAFNRLKINKQ